MPPPKNDAVSLSDMKHRIGKALAAQMHTGRWCITSKATDSNVIDIVDRWCEGNTFTLTIEKIN